MRQLELYENEILIWFDEFAKISILNKPPCNSMLFIHFKVKNRKTFPKKFDENNITWNVNAKIFWLIK